MYGLTLFAFVSLVVQSTYTQEADWRNSNEYGGEKLHQRFGEGYDIVPILRKDEIRRRNTDEDEITPRLGNKHEIIPRFGDYDEITPIRDEDKTRQKLHNEEELRTRFGGKDPVLGFGLGLPITNALAQQARGLARLNGWALQNKLGANRFRQNLRRVATRPFYHNPLRRILRETPRNEEENRDNRQNDWMRMKRLIDDELETSVNQRHPQQNDWMKIKGLIDDELETSVNQRHPQQNDWMKIKGLIDDELETSVNQRNPQQNDWMRMKDLIDDELGTSGNQRKKREVDWGIMEDPNRGIPRNQRDDWTGMNSPNMEASRGDWLETLEATGNQIIEQQDDWKRMKGPNMKRDEELFVWSLNYPAIFRVAELPPGEFAQNQYIDPNPRAEISKIEQNQDFANNHGAPNMDFNPTFREAPNGDGFLVNEEMPNNFDEFRAAMPEPHFHFLHKIIASHYQKKYGPSQVTINNQHTSINNYQSDSPHHGSPADNFGHSKNLQPFAAVENAGSVTINNQDNQISTTSGNIQIAQTTGHAASSQANGASHSGNIQISQTTSNAASSQANHVVGAPFIIQVPLNRRMYRRSLPLVRLVVDPNSKLDMPKTLQNVGTIARKSFEDQRAPMYHIRNVMGSLKNAFLSTLKIAPQDLIIPSQYKIVDAKEVAVNPEVVAAPMEEKGFKGRLFQRMNPKSKIDEIQLKRAAYAAKVDPRLGAEAPNEDPYNFLGTFQKVGAIFRDSVRSSHQVMQHISDAAHSARKAYTTSKFAAPRILLPYSRAPVLQKPLTMISPRFLDVNDNDANDALRKDDEMVKIGDLMDAFGLSHPEGDRVGLRRITIQKDSTLPLLQSRFGGDDNAKSDYFIIGEDIDENDLGTNFDDAWKSLEGIKSAVGVNTVKGFLQEMKEDFKRVREKVRGEREAAQSGDDELSNFFKKLFSRTPLKNAPNLNSRFQDDGNTNEETGEVPKRFKNLKTPVSDKLKDEDSVGRFKGARRFKNFGTDSFNPEGEETGLKNSSLKDAVKSKEETGVQEFKDEETVGAKLYLPENLWRPFMNQPSRGEVEKYFRDNGDDLEGFERSKKQDGSRKNVVDFGENGGKMDEEERARMKFHAKLLKPYMGKIKLKHGGYFDKDDYGYPFGEVYDQEYYD